MLWYNIVVFFLLICISNAENTVKLLNLIPLLYNIIDSVYTYAFFSEYARYFSFLYFMYYSLSSLQNVNGKYFLYLHWNKWKVFYTAVYFHSFYGNEAICKKRIEGFMVYILLMLYSVCLIFPFRSSLHHIWYQKRRMCFPL